MPKKTEVSRYAGGLQGWILLCRSLIGGWHFVSFFTIFWPIFSLSVTALKCFFGLLTIVIVLAPVAMRLVTVIYGAINTARLKLEHQSQPQTQPSVPAVPS